MELVGGDVSDRSMFSKNKVNFPLEAVSLLTVLIGDNGMGPTRSDARLVYC
jgi:hypothetical protein